MPPELAAGALAEASADGPAGLLVADLGWDRFGPVFTQDRPSALLADLAGPPADAEPEPPALELAALPAPDQERVLLELVRTHAAAVLGHDAPEGIDPDGNFLDLGFSSFTALELSNRLDAATGLRLPPVAIYDHPTPTELVRYVRSELLGEDPAATPVDAR
jgi:acyl carrier protein